MTDTELLHIEETDSRGYPTGHARCDRGDGTFPGGRLAVNSGTATCEACIEWEPDDEPDPPDTTGGRLFPDGPPCRHDATWLVATETGVHCMVCGPAARDQDDHDAQLGGPA